MSTLGLADLYASRQRLAGLVRRTPLQASRALDALAGGEVRLKLECLQETGAFKLRGATNKLASLSAEERAKGVIAVSTGNHGRAVAFAAKRLGVRAVVCLSELVPNNKLEAIRTLGAELVIEGKSQDEAEIVAGRLIEKEGLVYVHPFDDPAVLLGQGTIGLELIEDWPDLDTCLVPLSGGGLMAGIALALKGVNPRVRMIGITMEQGAAMHESIRAGRPVAVEEVTSLADSLGGGIGMANRWTFELCRELVDETLLVSEVEIAAGMRHLLMEERLVGEGGAAVGVAALLAGKVDLAGRRTAILVSGQNVDMGRLLEVVGQGGYG
jgi:threonine dehydratase